MQTDRQASTKAVVTYSSLKAAFEGGGQIQVRRGNVFGELLASFPNTPDGDADAVRFAANLNEAA